MNIRNITTKEPLSERIETGALRINDDWPGTFIRGDQSYFLAEQLQLLKQHNIVQSPNSLRDRLVIEYLDDLIETLEQCNLNRYYDFQDDIRHHHT